MPILKSSYNYFLETNMEEYKGEWVAVFNNSVISHGKDLKIVVQKAKRICSDKKFLLAKVPSDETMIF